MRLQLVRWLALGALGLTGCSLLTDLSGLSGGGDACQGGACVDGADTGALDARGGGDGGGDGGGAEATPCVLTDTVDPTLLSDAVALALGGGFSCALRTNGTVACWGNNDDGVLGPTTGDRATAATVPGLSRIVAITAGLSSACAIDADGHVWCWGDNSFGQLGNGPLAASPHPPAMVKGPGGQPLANVTAIDSGDNHVCAIVAGTVWCWGANDTLQLGRAGNSFFPGPISSLVNPVELAVGSAYGCAIADSDTTTGSKALYCWGYNGNSQLANQDNDTATPQKIPVSLAAVGTLPVAAAGFGHACARDPMDLLWCWGENDLGQLGPTLAPGPDQPMPQSLDVLGAVSMATAGDDYSCMLAHDGTTRCLGLDDNAQLGNGMVDLVTPDSGPPPPHSTPSLVTGLPPVSRISAGVVHTCAILARSCPNVPGPVMCWGQNDSGQLGGGTMTLSKVPVAVLAP